MTLKRSLSLRILTLCTIIATSINSAVATTLLDFPAGNSSVDALPFGTDLVRYWITAPEAKCNDGTQPAMYLQRAANQANRNNWVIYLQAGGSCGNGDECLERWSHTNSVYGIQKMSTGVPQATWQAWHPGMPGPQGWPLQVNAAGAPAYQIPESIAGQGIFFPNAANPFGSWNKVFVYYCSSDQHIGTVSDQTVTSTNSGNYTMHFRGASIFDAVIAELRSGAVSYPCANGTCTMPNLDNARKVLLAGSSAGANGVKHHLDRLQASFVSAGKYVDLRGVIDAAGSPFSAALPWRADGNPAFSYEAYFRNEWDNDYINTWKARVDASCLTENQPDLHYRCADSSHVLRHHVTTPFFHRMDLQDSNGIDAYYGFYHPTLGYPANLGAGRYARDIAMQLQDIGGFAQLLAPRYPNELNAITVNPTWLHAGIFGPRCGTHVALIYQGPFFNQFVLDSFGVARSYMDTLWLWVNQVPGGVAGPQGPVLIAPPGVGPMGAGFC